MPSPRCFPAKGEHVELVNLCSVGVKKWDKRAAGNMESIGVFCEYGEHYWWKVGTHVLSIIVSAWCTHPIKLS